MSSDHYPGDTPDETNSFVDDERHGAADRLAVSTLVAQQAAPAGPQPYSVGNRLGLPINPAPDGTFNPMSSNVKVYGAIYSAESCSYDPARGVIVVPNRGVAQNVQTNNAWISFINHDGSVHTARWVGIQNPGDQRSNMTPPLVLNEPLGSDIANGVLYLADRDGGTSPTDPVVSVIRRFNMQTGMPAGETASRNRPASTISRPPTTARSTRRRRARRPESGSDDVAGVEDHAGRRGLDLRPGRTAASAQRHRLRPEGQHRRRQHRQRRGADVRAGRQAAEDGERRAGRQRRPGDHEGRDEVREQRRQRRRLADPAGKQAELIAQNIPNPASMCYDAGANQLVIPMNANNGLAFIKLESAFIT